MLEMNFSVALFSRASFAELGAVDDLDVYKPVTLYSKVTKQTASSCLHHALFVLIGCYGLETALCLHGPNKYATD